MKYKVEITETCLGLIAKISDKKIKLSILAKIEALEDDPQKQGKALLKNLTGLRSIHAAGRYRIIYRLNDSSNIVWILAAGIRKQGDRKDIYEVAKKLLKSGLLG
ncbi:MAG: type II toxin-antitoxin system RelE/ParE family toxin [Desulfatiglandaceae bacterium]